MLDEPVERPLRSGAPNCLVLQFYLFVTDVYVGASSCETSFRTHVSFLALQLQEFAQKLASLFRVADDGYKCDTMRFTQQS